METQEVKYIPFNDIDELLVHFYTSQFLIESIASNLKLVVSSNPESYEEELRESVLNLCIVLRDGFAGMALSNEEGEVL